MSRLLFFLAFIPGLLLAAPDEALLSQPKSLVDVWSRMDEFHAARGVQKSAHPYALKRAERVPDLGLDAFLDENRSTGLLVLQGDAILAERYQYGRTAQHRFASASVAKTVLGMLVGIAIAEGKLSLDDTAAQHLPALKGHPYGTTPIRHLLTMSSGIKEEENRIVLNTLRRRTEGGVHSVLEFDRREVPAGERFRYSSADSQVLGLVLAAAVGKPLATYLSEKIWQPMGAEANATWIVDKGGYETGYCCLNATLRDYARFGLLLANHGNLNGKQIIPADWLKTATTAKTASNYGYQTWIIRSEDRRPREGTSPPNALVGGGDPVSGFAALGIHGQAIFIDPSSKLVVVHTAVWADPNDRDARRAQFRLWHSILAKLSQGQQS